MAINGFAELLLERLPEGTEEHDAADEIHTAGCAPRPRRASSSRSPRPTTHADPVRPQRARREHGDTLLSLSGRMSADRDQRERATVVADRDHVARAIVGCVLNARDAMPEAASFGSRRTM